MDKAVSYIRKIVRKILEENCNISGGFFVNKDIEEGVGDEYLKNKYPNFPDEEGEFEKKYQLMNLNKTNAEKIASKGGWHLIKNPGSLDNFGADVRGVIDSNGDLYLENASYAIHHDILKILFDKGILRGVFSKNWSRKEPSENSFITVQRKGNTNMIGIGESNKLIYDEAGWDRLKDEYARYMQKAKSKNSKIDFVNKLVGIKFNSLKQASNVDRITESGDKNHIIYI